MFSDILGYIRIYETEEEEKEVFFMQRTNTHIELVQNAVRKIVQAYPEFKELLLQVQKHDASKFEEPERAPYVKLTWQKKYGGNFNREQMLEIQKATLHHILHNSHHPEYHLENKEEANISAEDRDKSDRVIDATNMPDLDIAEMVADWQAMSEEIGINTAREWFDKQKDVRWHFSPEQEELINKLVKVFEEE